MNFTKVTSDKGRVTRKIIRVLSLSLVPRYSSLLLVPCALLLVSCGFHLRGNVDLPDSLSSIYIEGGLPNSPMREVLRQKLFSSGVNVVSQKSNAKAYLIIIKDETRRREVSWNSAGQPNEYELNYYLTYKLEGNDRKVLVAEQSLKQQRTYQHNPDQILVKEEEERRLKKKMVQAAVNQMLRRISTLMRKQDNAENVKVKPAPGEQPAVTDTTP